MGCLARVQGPLEALRALVDSPARWEGPTVASIELDMKTWTASRWPRGRGLAEGDEEAGAGDGGGDGGGGCPNAGAQAVGVPWHLDRLDSGPRAGLDRRFTTPLNLSGAGVSVFVLDTGIRESHQEFAGRVSPGINLVEGSGGGPPEDDNGHGTHCASIALGAGYGVAKCANVRGVKILDGRGLGSFSDVVRGLDWVATHAEGPSVVSMSLAGPPSDSINRALEEMADLGFLVVAAAGNEGEEACQYSPASSPDALVVGASDVVEAARGGLQDLRSPFSNYGVCVDVYAPGSSVEAASHASDSETVFRSGTSMACPLVAGVAALYLEAYPNASAPAVKSAIIQSSSVAEAPERFAPDTGPPRPRIAGVADLSVCPAEAEPVDCRVSDWGAWTTDTDCPEPADAPEICGLRLRRRTRSVLAEARCGGATCPPLWEEAPCPRVYPPCSSFYPMQYFGSVDPVEHPAPELDLRGRHLIFTPSGATGYKVCTEGEHSGQLQPIEAVDSATDLELGDDDSAEVVFGPGTSFPFFGQSYRSLHVSSNGFISVERDTSYSASSAAATTGGLNEILRTFWEKERIAVLFQDLNPGEAGGVHFEVKQDGGLPRLVVTYLDVPLWGPGGRLAGSTCTMQAVLHLNTGWSPEAGKIELWYGEVRGDYNPVTGLSPGLADPGTLGADFLPTHLAGAEQCALPAAPALPLALGPVAGLPAAQGSY